jgi:hypothetical protein
MLRDPEAPPEPTPPPPVATAEPEEEGEPIELEQTAIVPSTLRPEDAPAPAPAAPAAAPPAPAPAATPPQSAPTAAQPQSPAPPEGSDSFAAFAQMEPPEQLRSITPASGQQLDAVQDLTRLVVRLEKAIVAQGRAFRALVEILQEKGVVRRGELGSRTTKKP